MQRYFKKPIKITFTNTNDGSPEMEAEAQRRLRSAYDFIFDEAFKLLKSKYRDRDVISTSGK
jgi:hypothetical protein